MRRSKLQWPLLIITMWNSTVQASRVRFRHPGVYVDLGGIAKGYAVDRCIEIIRRAGLDQASVSAGGDSRILGDRRGQPWTVGMRDPRNEDRVVVLLPLEDTAVSTSGDYERYFEEDGVRYHHILDPRYRRLCASQHERHHPRP